MNARSRPSRARRVGVASLVVLALMALPLVLGAVLDDSSEPTAGSLAPSGGEVAIGAAALVLLVATVAIACYLVLRLSEWAGGAKARRDASRVDVS